MPGKPIAIDNGEINIVGQNMEQELILVALR